uniref:V-ATPase subunit E n=1 Tax=Candidatus Methanomethylicus mesodigestus TaxID=1867258 RepID=A0A7C3F5S1_9CREN
MINDDGLQMKGLKKLIESLFDEKRQKAGLLIDEALSRAIAVLEESERYSIKKAEEIISSYEEIAEIEARKEVSKTEIEMRMELLKLKESYVEKVFEGVQERLREFTKSEEYKSLLLGDLAKTANAFDAGEVLMRPEDIESLDVKKMKKALGGAIVKPFDIGIGGFIMISRDGKSRIDRTIDGIIRSEKERLRGKIAQDLFR